MSTEPQPLSCNNHRYESPSQTTHSSSESLFNFGIPAFRRGFDLRRPIMSQPTQQFIDLTEDTSSPPQTHIMSRAPTQNSDSTTANRPPRFDRNIINIDDQEDAPGIDLREESPEIQFLTSRPRSRSLSAAGRLARRRPELASASRSPGRRPPVPIRVTARERNSHQVPGFADALHSLQFPRPYHSNFGVAHGDELVGIEGNFPNARGIFQVPENLNFLQAGFNYEQPSRPQQQPRLPTYDPPPPAQRGFTRSPNDDDILVCPHCDDELGVGNEEVKRQVWVVKACGHVRMCDLILRSTLTHVSGLLWRVCNQ